MNRVTFRYTIFICVLGLLLVSCDRKKETVQFECADSIRCITIGPGQPIKIGVIQDLSGESETFGRPQLRSIELALETRRNTTLNHSIELVVEDGRCSPEGGKTAAEKLVSDDQILAIIGTSCSSSAVTASEVMSQAGLVMISGENTAASLTSLGGERGENWQAGYFRTVYNDAHTGQIAATFAFQELGIRRAATIDDGDTYSVGLALIFGQIFTDLGGEIVTSVRINKGDTDMIPVLESIADAEPDLLFMPLFEPEGNLVVKQLQDVNTLHQIVLMSTDSLLLDTFIQDVGSLSKGMYFASPVLPEAPSMEELRQKYETRYKEAPSSVFYSYAYDATNLLLDAVESAAVQDSDGTLHIGLQALRDALYGVHDVQGITGILTCDPFGDCSNTQFQILLLDNPDAGIDGLMSNAVFKSELSSP